MEIFKPTVTNIIALTDDTIQLDVHWPKKDLQFIPGQFFQFLVAENTYRSYSIASLPAELPTVTFCIKLETGGLGSAFVRGLHIGDAVPMRGPLGKFTVNDDDGPATFVATGVGVAPFCSMIPDLLNRQANDTVTLIFGVRNQKDVFYHDRFSLLAAEHKNFSFIPLLSQPSEGWGGGVGRVTYFLETEYQRFANSTYYLCGSAEMVKDTRALLLEKGHEMKKIKLEIFT